jgi:hypothetical protein
MRGGKGLSETRNNTLVSEYMITQAVHREPSQKHSNLTNILVYYYLPITH